MNLGKPFAIDKYNHVQLQEYNGKISIVHGFCEKDKFKISWCTVKRGNAEKVLPISIGFESKAKLMEFVEYVTESLLDPAPEAWDDIPDMPY